MYYTNKEPVYIGKAHKQTVWERYKGHKTDGVNKWIKKNIREPCKVKVGYLSYDHNKIKYSGKLLHDVESLIIFREKSDRGFCRANISNTITRNFYRPGMEIVNSHYYKPLLKYYRDD